MEKETEVKLERIKAKLESLPPPSHLPNRREVVRLRQAILSLYRRQGEITLIQAVAMLVAFSIGQEEGVLKLLGRGDEDTKRILRRTGWLIEGDSDKDSLFRWLDSFEIKRKGQHPGRKPRSDTLVLLLDTLALMCCPKPYGHLLNDALTLRAREYREEGNYARAHAEAWGHFHKAKRAVETRCMRLWKDIYGMSPGAPPKYWWERVARQEGLMG